MKIVRKWKRRWPESVEDALKRLETLLSPESRAELLTAAHGDLIKYHFGLGLWMRNKFGLHGRNAALIAELKHALGKPFGVDADDFSTALTELLWERVNGHEGPGVLARGAATRSLYANMELVRQAAKSGDAAEGLATLRDGIAQVRKVSVLLCPGTPGARQWQVEVVGPWEHMLEFCCQEYGEST